MIDKNALAAMRKRLNELTQYEWQTRPELPFIALIDSVTEDMDALLNELENSERTEPAFIPYKYKKQISDLYNSEPKPGISIAEYKSLLLPEKHDIVITASGYRYKAECSCGWMGVNWILRETAENEATQHISEYNELDPIDEYPIDWP